MDGQRVKNGEKYMEQTSQPANSSRSARNPLEAQLRECFGRIAYAHKTHEKCADQLTATLSRVKLLQITLSAITTGGIVTVIFGGKDISQVAAVVAAVVSTALLALNAYTKESDPGQKAEKHKEVASKLWDIRESYLSLLTDLRSGCAEVDARGRRDSLQNRLARIYETAPRTDSKAYAKAQEGLQRNEELTFSDEELDQLLPPALRG
jgi:hypothetical protein